MARRGRLEESGLGWQGEGVKGRKGWTEGGIVMLRKQ